MAELLMMALVTVPGALVSAVSVGVWYGSPDVTTWLLYCAWLAHTTAVCVETVEACSGLIGRIRRLRRDTGRSVGV